MGNTLKDLKVGQSAKVTRLTAVGALKRRLFDMGVTPETEVTLKKIAPLGDPIEINLRGYDLSLRKSEAETILVEDIR